jgi:predicted AlkP superfamily phosphohydrolase/phosphomutase
MSGRMIAIALDSVGDDQITDFFSKGYMPNLKRLSEGGVRCRLESQIDIQGHRLPYKSTEGCWVMAQTGVGPDTSNLWHAIQYDPEAYQIRNDHKSSAYDYVEYPPFYDLGDDYGVGIMDLNSGRILPAQKGKQVLGWGGHFPFVVQGSKPEGLLEQIKRRHGENPVYLKDAGVFWNPEYHQWLMEATLRALDQREAIINEFLQDPDLDLIMASIGETHSVLHEFWASVYPDHPLHEEGNSYSDAYEKVFSRTDRLIGSLMDQIKEEDTLAVYSVHGMKANSTDLPCLFFLAEMMYRLEFPGQAAISYSPAGGPVPPLITEGKHSYWFGDVWSQRVADWAWAQGWVERVPAWAQGFWSSKDLIYPFSMDLGGPGKRVDASQLVSPPLAANACFHLPLFHRGLCAH